MCGKNNINRVNIHYLACYSIYLLHNEINHFKICANKETDKVSKKRCLIFKIKYDYTLAV